MNYYNDIRELIGNTPVVKLNKMGYHPSVSVFAKLELFNPGGSVKDRMGVAMVEDAEARGILKPGGMIVEATAGNTGIGIALAAISKGYRVIFTVPEKFSVEKQVIMKAYGAKIINTPLEFGMKGAMDKAEELLKENKGAVYLSQFTNPSNPKIHYEETGREIYEALDGKIDYIVAGAGSGGTITGAAKYIKERVPSAKAVLADPYGSTMGGGEAGCYKVEGIGNDFMPETMDMSLIDKVIKTNDEESFAETRLLSSKEGILAGSSSGAALSAVRKLIQEVHTGNIVVILPDRGDRYFSKNLYM